MSFATWRCSNGTHKGERDRRLPSSTAFTLKETECIPVVRGGQASLARARDIWRPTAEMPHRVRKLLNTVDPSVGRISAAMAEWLGFVEGGNATSSDLVSLLRSLARETDPEADLSNEDREAAHWLLRRLNQAWTANDNLRDANEVPLLAEQDGKLKLATRPYLASDPLLAATWSDVAPIYEGDHDLHSLLDGLGLPVLDEKVSVQPLSGDPDSEAARLVWDRLAEVGPAIIALAARDVPSRVDEIAVRLHLLEIICSSELLLEYRFEPHEPRLRSDATVYFAAAGTVYLRVEDGEPDWSTFGLRLADYLDVDLGDAMALLITAEPRTRRSFLGARGIAEEDLQRAAEALVAASERDVETEFEPESDAEERDADDGAADVAVDNTSGGVSHEAAESESEPTGTEAPSTPTLTRVAEEHVPSGPRSASDQNDGNQPTPSGHPAQTPAGSGTGSGRDRPAPGAPVPQRRGGERSHAGLAAALRRRSQPTASTYAEDDSRFFSYVVAGGTRESRMAARAEAEAMRIGSQGVDRVVEFEAAAGRVASPQEHSNKGFDVISQSADGSDRRIIEVKATTGDWPQRGIPVSSSQIEKNLESGDDFWLYVVEHTEDPERAHVIPIQNPAASVDYFVFDPGWRQLSAE